MNLLNYRSNSIGDEGIRGLGEGLKHLTQLS
jgi:hypothetical protein